MNNDELNKRIKHYLEKDKTKSAIMLTAPWGAGKSYYIQNILRPYLEEKNQCVVISLYGLSSIIDVNRSLFFELHFNKVMPKKKLVKASLTVGKTILKNVASVSGIDINLSEQDLTQIYSSIDLKDKLIIFEDLERTSLDVIEFLGYINNLVEQDGGKVLLVANEEELLKYQTAECGETANKNEKKDIWTESKNSSSLPEKELSDASKQYMRIKEKTISDTLFFTGDTRLAISSIVSGFVKIKDVLEKNDKYIDEVISVFNSTDQRNLRSFLVACQKANDIISLLEGNDDDAFKECIFFGILIFILKSRNGDEIQWGQEVVLSYELGNSKYPLFKFCYEYIVNHSSGMLGIKDANIAFTNARLYASDKSDDDRDLNIIFNFMNMKETEVKGAILNVEQRLSSDVDDISFYRYGLLANYLIYISQYVDCDIEECLKYLVSNLNGRGDFILADHLFRQRLTIENNEKMQKYLIQKNAMLESLNKNKKAWFEFNYKPERVSAFCTEVYNSKGRFTGEKIFAKRLNMSDFASMVFKCSANEIDKLRIMFGDIYGTNNIKEFLSGDRESLEELFMLLKEFNRPKEFDGIQQMQVDFLIENLEDYIIKLS